MPLKNAQRWPRHAQIIVLALATCGRDSERIYLLLLVDLKHAVFVFCKVHWECAAGLHSFAIQRKLEQLGLRVGRGDETSVLGTPRQVGKGKERRKATGAKEDKI